MLFKIIILKFNKYKSKSIQLIIIRYIVYLCFGQPQIVKREGKGKEDC